MKIELYKEIVITKDLPEYNLRKGDVVVVVEHLPATPGSSIEEGYALEVFNNTGKTKDVIMVPASVVKLIIEGVKCIES